MAKKRNCVILKKYKCSNNIKELYSTLEKVICDIGGMDFNVWRKLYQNEYEGESVETDEFAGLKATATQALEITKGKCESADALYLKKHVYLLEFKTGFASEKSDANTKTHKENLKLRIRLKA